MKERKIVSPLGYERTFCPERFAFIETSLYVLNCTVCTKRQISADPSTREPVTGRFSRTEENRFD